MRRTADGRSAALARAQAQLAGRRGAAKTHGGVLGGGSSGRLAIPVASEWSALSGSSARAGRKEAEKESLAEPPRPHGLFLKQKPSVVGDAGPAGLRRAAGRSLSAASKGRSSCVLRKLEQIESKFRSRKAQLDVNLALSEEELSWSKSSQDPQPRTGGSLRFLKRSPAPKENRTPSAPHLHTLIKNVPLGLGADRDSEEDDEGGILGISQKPEGLEGLLGVRLRGKPFQTSLISFPTKTPSPPSLGPSHPARRSLKGPSHRTLSPPSWNVLRLSGAASRLSSPSLRESGAGAISPKAGSGSPSGRSWSRRSNIRSLDELFSEGTDPHSSSSDFRVNVLSLDDLAPTVASQAEELEEEEAAGWPDKEPEVALRPIPTQSPFKASPALETTAATLEEEDNLGASDISEQLSGGSAEGPPSRAESLVATEYSDDFEPSAAAEETEGESSAGESQASSNASVSFSPSDSASHASSPLAGNRNTQPPTRVTVKEAAVQTSSSSFAYHWLQTEAAATLGQTEGGSTVAAGPSIARHVVSWEAIEALTTYSPAALALNDLLKQNVLLIRQYVEASRQLHASIVAALEEEHFHYHTLDEAKASIARHKPPPLTMEQALQELTEERSRAC